MLGVEMAQLMGSAVQGIVSFTKLLVTGYFSLLVNIK